MPERHRRQTSASGGRANELGIVAQYRWAAMLTLRHLHEASLQCIYLRDTGAGQVDDFQLLTKGGVLRAFQIKWAQDAGHFSLTDLLRGKGGKPSLMRALAGGWRNRRNRFRPAERRKICRLHLPPLRRAKPDMRHRPQRGLARGA